MLNWWQEVVRSGKIQSMLIGEYHGKISSKKRTSLPKKFRDELGENIILTRGYENALILVNENMWKNIAQDVINGSFINKNIRDTSRFLIGGATEVETDKQGRFIIPQPLFDHAQLKEDVVFIGLVNWVEVWDKEKWSNRLEYLKQNGDEIAQELTKMTNNKNE